MDIGNRGLVTDGVGETNDNIAMSFWDFSQTALSSIAIPHCGTQLGGFPRRAILQLVCPERFQPTNLPHQRRHHPTFHQSHRFPGTPQSWHQHRASRLARRSRWRHSASVHHAHHQRLGKPHQRSGRNRDGAHPCPAHHESSKLLSVEVSLTLKTPFLRPHKSGAHGKKAFVGNCCAPKLPA